MGAGADGFDVLPLDFLSGFDIFRFAAFVLS
jgi:hypothetical protein